jgi:PAS domain S-box-containing protein
MLRGSSDAPWDLDLVRGEHYVSPRLWQLLGRPHSDIAADPVLTQGLLHPDEQAALAQQLRAALAGHGDSFEAELRLRHQAGHFVPLLARGYILRDAQGRALRLSGTCVDLTERHRAEAEVRELNASLERRVAERTLALEQANHELEAFSYSVSHDLRAPLRAVDGLAALLQQDHDEALGDQGRERLRLLRASAMRMTGLIHDLLEFARTARQTPRRTQVPVAALVRHCLEEFRGEIDIRAIAVTLGELPDASADPTLLRQVFVNLLGNAVKYTRRQPQARIEVGIETQQGQVVYVVRDNGTGFDMRHAKKLFGVFQRLHADAEFEGSGVGLAIVDRIVRRHGGRVWAQAMPGEGAAFFFTLGPAPAAD